MSQPEQSYYKAYAARDARFDGVFYIGVTSTGIYCRPICTARTPKEANCCFYENASSAEKAGFRPCLRCRPELAPGTAPVDDARRIACLIMQRIETALTEDGVRLDGIASQFDLSTRQLRRIVQKQLGVSPVELVQTRRLLLAKQLLTETALPITQVAYASGFGSLRRFNHAFSTCYGMPPTRLRKTMADTAEQVAGQEALVLQLSYRPPYDWAGILKFLEARCLKGVECISADSYARTVRLGTHTGWVKVAQLPGKNALAVTFAQSLLPVLQLLLSRLRSLFDLDARPDLISGHLSQDILLRAAVLRNPGLRVPGAFDAFELVVRAILGQQITVKAATTLAGRYAEAFGQKIKTPLESLTHLTPVPELIAKAGSSKIAALGVIATRASSIHAVAEAFVHDQLKLEAGAHPEALINQLTSISGIGKWTAHYIAMRALRWPDAFPKEDIIIRNNLGDATAAEADTLSQAWRPWRSYAVMHIWNNMPLKKRKQKLHA